MQNQIGKEERKRQPNQPNQPNPRSPGSDGGGEGGTSGNWGGGATAGNEKKGDKNEYPRKQMIDPREHRPPESVVEELE